MKGFIQHLLAAEGSFKLLPHSWILFHKLARWAAGIVWQRDPQDQALDEERVM